ncbi:MAG: 3-isopropylmalate dehydrogenase [Polyangiaceae bacterium]|nr:3-isopropylmalate dehydrogenase [Polyangiaceae bacterium]
MSDKTARIVTLPGDGIGPEVCGEAANVLRLVLEQAGRGLELIEKPLGGCALDAGDEAFPAATKEAVLAADAVLLGAVGLPKYDGATGNRRPEKGLLDLRQAMGVFANLRPVRAIDALNDASPLKNHVVKGTDMIVVRELLGGVYFGEPRGIDGDRGFNTMVYTKREVVRVAKVAFEIARGRGKRLLSVDKANVLEVSQLWRQTVTELQQNEYPDIALDHQYVDSAAMDLIRQPTKFDVVVTSNLFGDILTDAGAVLAGSIGLLSSASLGEGPGLYEPIHGSAPDIAGQGIANPLGAIGSVASLLRNSLQMPEEATRVETIIDQALADGHRTADLGGKVTTKEMGDIICQALKA